MHAHDSFTSLVECLDRDRLTFEPATRRREVHFLRQECTKSRSWEKRFARSNTVLEKETGYIKRQRTEARRSMLRVDGRGSILYPPCELIWFVLSLEPCCRCEGINVLRYTSNIWASEELQNGNRETRSYMEKLNPNAVYEIYISF
ncbi:hypothetical protein JTB14_001991 [Gonioctena quinquepunctata]|nr:hypothetical protein JTB14_001991 [Gonioctena quinquepunctata]